MNSFRIFQIVLAVLLSLATGVVWVTAYQNTQSIELIEEEQKEQQNDSTRFNLIFDSESISFNEEGTAEINVWTDELDVIIDAAEMHMTFDTELIEVLNIKKGTVFDIYLPEQIDNVNGKIVLAGAFMEGMHGDAKQVFAQLIIKKKVNIPERQYFLNITQDSKATLSSQNTIYIEGDQIFLEN